MEQKDYNALTIFIAFCLFPALFIWGFLIFGIYSIFEGLRLITIQILQFIIGQFDKLDKAR